jgi:hypothetical protein
MQDIRAMRLTARCYARHRSNETSASMSCLTCKTDCADLTLIYSAKSALHLRAHDRGYIPLPLRTAILDDSKITYTPGRAFCKCAVCDCCCAIPNACPAHYCSDCESLLLGCQCRDRVTGCLVLVQSPLVCTAAARADAAVGLALGEASADYWLTLAHRATKEAQSRKQHGIV